MSIKTLIVDDSIAYRKILTEVANKFQEIQVIGSAPNGAIALKKLEGSSIQLVLLDVFMPEMDGVETLKHIRKDFPKTLVIMVSGQTTRNADITVRALEMGAIDFILKPKGKSPEESMSQLKRDFQSILQLVRIKLNLQSFGPSIAKGTYKKPMISGLKKVSQAGSYGVVAIGSSTGGPEALGKVIPNLSADLSVPVVMVQHMPPVFTRFLAESLDKKSRLNVVEGKEGMELKPGCVYIAPGGKHMTVRSFEGKKILGLNENPPENSCRPAVDVLFRSLTSSYTTSNVLAVILTGMGQDGLNGVKALKRQGCYCITQSAATCVVYGMPRAVDEAGLSDKSLPIDSIYFHIQSLLKGVKKS